MVQLEPARAIIQIIIVDVDIAIRYTICKNAVRQCNVISAIEIVELLNDLIVQVVKIDLNRSSVRSNAEMFIRFLLDSLHESFPSVVGQVSRHSVSVNRHVIDGNFRCICGKNTKRGYHYACCQCSCNHFALFHNKFLLLPERESSNPCRIDFSTFAIEVIKIAVCCYNCFKINSLLTIIHIIYCFSTCRIVF